MPALSVESSNWMDESEGACVCAAFAALVKVASEAGEDEGAGTGVVWAHAGEAANKRTGIAIRKALECFIVRFMSVALRLGGVGDGCKLYASEVGGGCGAKQHGRDTIL